MKCTECGGTELTRSDAPNYHYTGCGLDNVVVKSGITIDTCRQCGETFTRIPRIVGLHTRIAGALIYRAGRLAGAEIAFLRKHMDLSETVFANQMGVCTGTVYLWEKGEVIPSTIADRLIRMLAGTTAVVPTIAPTLWGEASDAPPAGTDITVFA